jgi:ABC-type cobalamin/Fe3+-siderophores transport system ATPase subunit
MQMQVTVPDVATVVVTGPVGCGKSAVMGRLQQVLRDEFGATVVLSEPLRREANGRGGDLGAPLADWERKAVTKTTWVLHES